ncbi:MAG TPA: methyltransferase domain-containing protein [Gemmataceae bacterium]|jgi:hypothetical protein|nr:methyltransferase domain-containing protein [Gemmataceae bacterium]
MKAIAARVKRVAHTLLDSCGYTAIPSCVAHFRGDRYVQHNARRLEHLASLRIPVRGLSVLELGAGVGDHSSYYLDRDCRVTITEARGSLLSYLRKRFPSADVRALDMESPEKTPVEKADVVHCYGLLYHLSDPERALDFVAGHTDQYLFLETCVSFGDGETINPTPEDMANPTQAISGVGCRPTRPWLLRALKSRFEHVYVPQTQPNHEEFPTDWSVPGPVGLLARAVFVCSRTELANDLLLSELPSQQRRHE